VRKVSFFAETWNEYLQITGKLIPQRIRNRFCTRKAAYIALAVISIDLMAALLVYWL
jgi:hypothetical protein